MAGYHLEANSGAASRGEEAYAAYDGESLGSSWPEDLLRIIDSQFDGYGAAAGNAAGTVVASVLATVPRQPPVLHVRRRSDGVPGRGRVLHLQRYIEAHACARGEGGRGV